MLQLYPAGGLSHINPIGATGSLVGSAVGSPVGETGDSVGDNVEGAAVGGNVGASVVLTLPTSIVRFCCVIISKKGVLLLKSNECMYVGDTTDVFFCATFLMSKSDRIP
mmetsp:Transcript_9315/g.10302  ORF Transcript_9315/g.10302 Transcript_9315/m.10302 type:complete len:109 (-) Transcript_9315:640-966(-)